MPMMHRNKSVSVHQFAMTPRAEIPRSGFRMQRTYKSSFDAGYLVPVFCEEVLPGDTFNLHMTAFTRLATPLFPFMDNLYLDSFFFFVPNRLVWTNWQKFMGEQEDPGDSISFTIPQSWPAAGGYAVGTLHDYFGLPTVGQVGAGNQPYHSNLPLRGYNLIYNEWFRDENLQNSVVVDKDDGPDASGDYVLLKRGKRHDYFTGALPWLQKGTSVPLPLGSTAPVVTTQAAGGTLDVGGGTGYTHKYSWHGYPTGWADGGVAAGTLFADLTQATAATINEIREAFQIQRLLERDARGGTRYVELLYSHFGVRPPDFRLQRPEYLGGSSVPISINPIAQTSATDITGGSTPQANLAAVGTGLHQAGFTQSFTEHGYVIGLVNVRADLTYQQGLRRHWSRATRYDFYFPVFAHLGEQAILNKEIYCKGDGNDDLVFGYQERWAEYRYLPSEVTSLMRSTAASSIDAWHLAQEFTALPTLNSTFISESPPIDRVVAVGTDANGQQFLFDAFFDIKAARPMPLYSVPGQVDHF